MSSTADLRVAKRYATALFNTSTDAGSTSAVQSSLQALLSLWDQTPALRTMMTSPLIPTEQKQAVVGKIFDGTVDSLTASFLTMLVAKRREEILPAVCEEFSRQADAAQGLVRATASVAAPISAAMQAELTASLEARSGKKVELKVAVDPGLIGGVVVRMQDSVIDGSVRGALERLRERLLLESA